MPWYELGHDVYVPPLGPWTNAELDNRYDRTVERFPGGLSYEQFVYLTLESARECDELCHPPSIALDGHGHENSATWHMWLKQGLIEHRGGRHAPLRWYITSKGRDELTRLRPKYDPVWLARVADRSTPETEGAGRG